jgi:hypothetical protein
MIMGKAVGLGFFATSTDGVDHAMDALQVTKHLQMFTLF